MVSVVLGCTIGLDIINYAFRKLTSPIPEVLQGEDA